MISLWISDLHVSSVMPEAVDSTISPGENVESTLARMEVGLAVEKKRAEIEKATKFFEKAKGRMKRRSPSFHELYIDDPS